MNVTTIGKNNNKKKQKRQKSQKEQDRRGFSKNEEPSG